MNRELVQELRDLISGIPEKRVDLSWPWKGASLQNPPEPCSAVACMAGWAYLYPPFITAGIRDVTGMGICSAAYIFFGIPPESNFFSARCIEREIGPMTDKQIALARLDRLLGIRTDVTTE